MRDRFHDIITRAPMIRVGSAFVAGIALAPVLGTPVLMSGVFTLVMLTWWVALSRRRTAYAARWRTGLVLLLLMFAFGVFWRSQRAPEREASELAAARLEKSAWLIRTTEVISNGARATRCWAEVEAAVDSLGATPLHGRLLVTFMKDSAGATPFIGDRILVQAPVDTLDRVPDPGAFDQATWAASYGVYHTCFAPLSHYRVLFHGSGWATWFDGARARVTAWLNASGLSERERGMVKAILLGVRDELDAEQKSAFARSGTMHVLAVSGSHVMLIYAFLVFASRPFGQKRSARIVRSVLILIVMWYYAGLTGATPSVLRATVTLSIFCLGDMIGRLSDPINSLFGAAFLLVFWDPLMLTQLSFQLSFLAVLGIALFYRPILFLWAAPNKPLAYFWSLFSVSLAAQALTTPLALYAFHAFPVWFLPANLIVVGLVALGVYGGSLLLLFQWVPGLSDAIAWCMAWLLRAIGFVTDLFAHLPMAYPAVRVDGWQCAGLYLFVLLMSGWLFERWKWARMACISLLAVLLCSWAFAAHQRNHQRQLVIYGTRDQLVGAAVSGRNITVFADSLDDGAIRQVVTHARSAGVQDLEGVSTWPALIQQDALVVQVDQGAGGEEATGDDVDLLVLRRVDERAVEQLLARCKPRLGCVIAPDVTYKERIAFTRACEQAGVPVHDVRAHGAYVR